MIWLLAASAYAAVTIEHVPCADAPKAVIAAVCAGAQAGTLTHVAMPHHDAWLGWDVQDRRGADGPYFERAVVLIDGTPGGDGEPLPLWLSILKSAGPVANDADALARLTAVFDLTLGLDARPAEPIAIGARPCGGRAPISLQCGVEGDRKDGYRATIAREDSPSCNCAVTWSKTWRYVVHLAPDGTLTADEAALVACSAHPESQTAQVCAGLQ